MSIPAILLRENPIERRRDERWRVCFGARWLDARLGGRPLNVLDVSASGFLIRIDQALPVGTCIVVELPDGVCKVCKIVWNSGNYHGARFSEPLSTPELDRMLAPNLTTWPAAVELVDAGGIGPLAQDKGQNGADDDVDGRMPFATSARLVAGTAAMAWALLGAGLWLVAE